MRHHVAINEESFPLVTRITLQSNDWEQIGRIELHSVQLGRLTSHLEITCITTELTVVDLCIVS